MQAGLKLEVSRSLTIRVKTDKRQERAAYSTTGPLAVCGFIKRNDNHISQLPLCLADVPLGDTFLTALFVSASVENEGQDVSAGQAFLLYTEIRGLNTCNILSLKLLFFL